MEKLIASALVAAMLVGCATYRPIVDPRNTDMNRYAFDLAECQQIAEQNAASATDGAVGGNHDYAEYGAGIGAASGMVQGAAGAEQGQRHIIAR